MDFTRLSAFDCHLLLKDGRVSSRELTTAFIKRAGDTDEVLRAFITFTPERALKDADRADEMLKKGEGVSPLTGIPVAIKDLIITRGIRTTCGSRMLENFIPPYSSTVMDRLEKAGAVLMGKTNLDEFGMGSSTENSAFFPSRNPWDTDRVPGGSSGGSAVAVSAGQVPLSLGTDTGGSIRQPSAFCGVCGLKPTYGAVSRYGLVAFASSLDQIGPISRDVRDLAMALDVITGHDPADSTSAEMEKPGYLAGIADFESIRGMKIGFPVNLFEMGMDGGVKAVLMSARKVLEDLGAEMVDVNLNSIDYALPAYYIIAPSEASSNLARFDGVRYGLRVPDQPDAETMYKKTRRAGFGEEVIRRILTGTYALSAGYYSACYLKAQKVRTLIRRDFERAFENCDVIFSPATPTTAFRLGEKTGDPVLMYLSDIFTVSLNMAGLPGIVFPCGFSDGLPVGCQLMGKHFDELSLLRIGAVFQRVTEYHKVFPDV